MDRDIVIRLAQEARLVTQTHPLHPWGATDADLERFAALVAAAEREACAVAAELVPAQWDYPVEIPHPAQACHDCAAAIRARGHGSPKPGTRRLTPVRGKLKD